MKVELIRTENGLMRLRRTDDTDRIIELFLSKLGRVFIFVQNPQSEYPTGGYFDSVDEFEEFTKLFIEEARK
jgi:hypothetical protein